jgi:DNA replication and repair protein RecF
VNILHGKNGHGKTNVLEGLSYISLTKSFFGAADRTVLQFGAPVFFVEATIRTDAGSTHTLRVIYDDRLGEKRFTVNGVEPERSSAVIGRFPFVVLSPEHDAVTVGGPAERRRWIDLLLSQISPVYLAELIEYRRALHQRNRLLLDAKLEHRSPGDLLGPWSEALVRHGTALVLRRKEFIQSFVERFSAVYRAIAGGSEEASISYRSGIHSGDEPEEADVARVFAGALERRTAEEMRRGITLTGPHRDDLVFTLDGLNLQEYGSQGQHKTSLVALKFAEYDYLREQRNEAPQFLLDDLFSDLDAERSENILNRLGGMGQCVITMTDAHMFERQLKQFSVSAFCVDSGTCRAV